MTEYKFLAKEVSRRALGFRRSFVSGLRFERSKFGDATESGQSVSRIAGNWKGVFWRTAPRGQLAFVEMLSVLSGFNRAIVDKSIGRRQSWLEIQAFTSTKLQVSCLPCGGFFPCVVVQRAVLAERVKARTGEVLFRVLAEYRDYFRGLYSRPIHPCNTMIALPARCSTLVTEPGIRSTHHIQEGFSPRTAVVPDRCNVADDKLAEMSKSLVQIHSVTGICPGIWS